MTVSKNSGKKIVNKAKAKDALMEICGIADKGKMYGHNVSFSQRHTRKVFKPNTTKKTLVIDGKKKRVNISASALRTLRKKGIIETPQQRAARAEKK